LKKKKKTPEAQMGLWEKGKTPKKKENVTYPGETHDQKEFEGPKVLTEERGKERGAAQRKISTPGPETRRGEKVGLEKGRKTAPVTKSAK